MAARRSAGPKRVAGRCRGDATAGSGQNVSHRALRVVGARDITVLPVPHEYLESQWRPDIEEFANRFAETTLASEVIRLDRLTPQLKLQVLAGVVDVHDRGGLGQDRGSEVPDPGGAVAEHDGLADVIGAAAAGLDGHQGGELLGGGEAAQVAGGVGVPNRSAFVVGGGLGT